MFKTLFLTCLLAGCSSVDSLKPLEPKKAVSNYYNLSGIYNFVTDFSGLYDLDGVGDLELTFDNHENAKFSVPFSYDDFQWWYLESITIENAETVFDCIFYFFDNAGEMASEPLLLRLEANYDIHDVTNPYVRFYVLDNLFLDGIQSQFFNSVFTHEDNGYVVSYSGYYSFNNNSGLEYGSSFLGTFSYNNTIGNFLNYYDNTYNVGNYDVVTSKYTSISYDDVTDLGVNLYLTGVKFTDDNLAYFRSVGVFEYVPDHSHDSDTFKDLLFGVMDSPLYFIHMLLGFELFGVELYVAFASILTLLLIVICIKKMI